MQWQTLRTTPGNPEILVTEYGGLKYFSQQHLLYAIPAIISLCTLVLFPIIYLLLIPVTLKLLHVCKFSEHQCVLKAVDILKYSKLMPMRDIFQSCFKNDLRLFAGIYFAYRVCLCAVITFSGDSVANMVITELGLVIVLGIHAIAQPYKDRVHNMLDAALFLNLVIINTMRIILHTYLTLYIDFSSDKEITGVVALLTSVQIFLICIPIIGIGIKIMKAVKVKVCSSRSRGGTEALLAALEEEHEDELKDEDMTLLQNKIS